MSTELRVLLVEDSDDDALLLLMELERGEWQVLHQRVDTAAGMIAALEAQTWDIIISDYAMPRFSGTAALTIAHQRAPDVPFILVSGTVGEELAVVAMKAGAHDYIMKGNLARLRPAVEREIADAAMRCRNARELREAHENLELRVEQRTAELADANKRLTVEIAERELAERRLHALNDRLVAATRAAELANEAKSSFLANISHEIRTPMSAILGYAELLLEPHLGQSDRLDYINTIRRNGEHLLAVVNDVLDLSKIEAGKFQVECLDCCPCQVLSDVASLMRVRAIEKFIRLDVKNEGLVPATIRTDPARLRQILINLIGNAIKFTDEGWVRLIMRLDETAHPPRLRFDVIDTGIGMSREQMAAIFQPFVQGDSSTTRRFGGTGLGLAISKHLAEMLGGRIDVDSSPGRGSTFTLFIDPGPLEGVQRYQNCREALGGTSPNEPRHREQVELHGRVLLVDDGHDNRRLLSVYLREAGLDVELAENGRTGCDAALAAVANGEPFDVVLMDMQMPELDGYGAATRLRQKGYQGPIVALTAHAMAEDRQKCLDAGCSDYLRKPVRRQDLLGVIATHLAHGITHTAAGAAGPVETAAPPPAGPIKSDLSDEALRPFLQTYVGELPARVAILEASFTRNDFERLATEVHNLSGTGGLYGLMPISDAAAGVERLLQAHADVDAIKRQVRHLIDIIGRVEGVILDRPPASPSEQRETV
jgi:signal transduction histidine kinase